jgi:hypothetical protein
MDSNRSDQAVALGQWAHPYRSAEHMSALERSARLPWGERVQLQLLLWLMLVVVAVVLLASRLLPSRRSD